jgi:hypothetical protein
MNLTLSASSTLLLLARYGGLQPGIAWSSRDKCFERTDLCSLFWCTLWGLVRAPFWVLLFGTLGAAVIGFAVGYPLIAILAWLIEGLALDAPALVGVTFWCVLPLAYAFGRYVLGPLTRSDGPVYTAADFIRAGYQSWRQKTCILVDLKEV